MAQIQKLDIETKVKCNADKMFGMIKNDLPDLPKIMPETFKDVDILQGDGKSVGSVRVWKFVPPGSSSILTTKEKTEAIDERSRTITWRILEGYLMNHYKSFVAKVHVAAKGDGCSVKWSFEFEKKSEDAPSPKIYAELGAKTIEFIGAFLLKA